MRKLSVLLIAIMFLFSFSGLAWAYWEGPGGECNELNCGRPGPPNGDDSIPKQDDINAGPPLDAQRLIYAHIGDTAREHIPVF